MNWPKQNLPIFKVLMVLATCWGLLACGVKGDPLPPEKPVELGRGRPTYKRATEGIKIEKAKPRPAPQQEDEDDDEDE